MIIIQIGTNKGNDDLTSIIQNKQPEKLILIEPLDIHNIDIKKCYDWVSNLIIENIAISINDEEKMSFFIHEKDKPGYEVASSNKSHIIKHLPNLNSDESGIIELQVKCMTINKLFEKYNLTNIDILFIDAEGMDDKIIKTINFEKYNIKKIYFENLHLTENDIFNFLKNKSYNITNNIGTYGWCTLAEKNNPS